MRKIAFGMAVLGSVGLQTVQAQDIATLLQANACSACHQPATRVVGPSWKEIADKYRDGSKTAAQLSETIKTGSTGTWGAVPMPPQAQLSDADRTSIAEWILTSN
ncbi:c-type cytochrome [Pseudomonas sp. SO81]|uniref:c-type cytochrome n=1 Tax=Pseudomonas sp. SO81 TaxID=2983246 RepID=UPI0025A3991B|nr:c-type cytochrome [Pseudomonas sp. SO81]WJN60747.1 cytochrome c552 [Pseudomonas sp. SO81]